jgi:hypothetical protein
MAPGGGAAAVGDRGDAGVLLELIGGGVTCTLFAEGDKEAGGQDGAGARQSLTQGEGRMALGALCNSVGNAVDGVHGHAPLRDEGVDQEGLGSAEALIGGHWCGALDGLQALVDDGGVTHGMSLEKALARGAPREVGGLEGWPWGEEIAADGGRFVVEPWEDLREVVLQGTGEAVGEAHVVAHEAAAMFDKLLEGTHVGALGGERCEVVAMPEQEVEVEFGVRGGILGGAGGEGLAVAREGKGMNGKEHADVGLAQDGDKRALSQVEAEGERLPLEPLAQGAHPGLEGFWRVLDGGVLAFVSAAGLSADIVLGLGPIDADVGGKVLLPWTWHGSPPEVYDSGERGPARVPSATA